MSEKVKCNDARKIYIAAEAFAITSFQIVPLSTRFGKEEKDNEMAVHLGYAATANYAFAIELYLKCLSCIENKHFFYKGHNLKELFDILGEENKQRIKEYHLQIAKKDEFHTDVALKVYDPHYLDVDHLLEVCGDAFRKFRYNFSNNFDLFYLSNVAAAIRKRIQEINPEWKSYYESK